MTIKELIDHLSKMSPDMPVLTVDTCYCCTEEKDLTSEDIAVLPAGYKYFCGDRRPIDEQVVMIGASSMYADADEVEEE